MHTRVLLLLFLLLIITPNARSEYNNTDVKITSLEITSSLADNRIDVLSTFEMTNAPLIVPVRAILYTPSNNVLYDADTYAHYLVFNQHYLSKIDNITVGEVEKGTYKIYYYLDEDTVVYGVFELSPGTIDHDIVGPMTYDTDEMKHKVQRFVIFSIICILIFIFLATR